MKMKAEVTKGIYFQSRLKVLSNFGTGIVDPVFNGFPNTVFYSFNAANTPSDTTVKLERAYVTWKIRKTRKRPASASRICCKFRRTRSFERKRRRLWKN